MSCEKSGCELHGWAGRFQNYFKALHCPTRWLIIGIIGDDEKSTSTILKGLRDKGEQLARSSLYYHLSELEKAGIIELAKYKEAGGGAPEKMWRLKVKEIKVDLLNPPRS